jgi:hypothetical protein
MIFLKIIMMIMVSIGRRGRGAAPEQTSNSQETETDVQDGEEQEAVVPMCRSAWIVGGILLPQRCIL